MTRPRPPFIWPLDGEADKWVSDATVAEYFDMSRASVERVVDRPPVIFIGRLKRSSAHAWSAWARRRLATALTAASKPALPAPTSMTPIAPELPQEPPVKRKRTAAWQQEPEHENSR
jgi:hypothetical protein